jgi:hypothetical protein
MRIDTKHVIINNIFIMVPRYSITTPCLPKEKQKGPGGKAKGARGIIVDFYEELEGMANVVGW